MNDEALPPVSHRPGDRIKVHIDSIAYGGEGVGRVDDFVIFVAFTAPGEDVLVELVEVKKKFARGRVAEVLAPSSDRIPPVCPHFGDCGGCQYQHLSYDAQLRLKHQQIRDLLQRLGGFHDLNVDPVLPCPSPYHYRNRIMVRTQWDKFERRLRLGFIRHDNRLVVDIESCPIAEPALNDQLPGVRANPPPKGGLKVTLRIPPPGWDVPPDSFFQNNFHVLPALVQTVRDRLGSSGTRHLIDAYCGVGFFALECAAIVERFTGVEIDKLAIKSARRNQETRGIHNGDFVVGPAEEWIPALLGRYPADQTTVLTDPPRVGCAPPFIDALRAAAPAQIIYVSCHPATLSRDLKALCADHLYRVDRVTPVDMFPQTHHVECVVDLRRVAGAGG